jgi:Domain of Unknown Function (DUF928)
MTQFMSHFLVSTTVAGVLIFSANVATANSLSQQQETLKNQTLISLQFRLPGDPAPKTNVSGGVRGNVQFGLPGDAKPKNTVSGGVRGSVQFGLPSDKTKPNTSVSGGVRGNSPELTALVPSTQLGRTASAHPTIFAYLPPLGVEEVFFSIQDEAGNPHYHGMVKVSPEGGIIRVTLPENAPELIIGTNYLWYFAPIQPGEILRPDNYAVTGWIKRVETTVNAQQLSPVELATEYAKEGIWYDTLKVLSDAKLANPSDTNVATEWQELLEQVGLDAIAFQPLS